MDKESLLREQMKAQRQMLEDSLIELKNQNKRLVNALKKVRKRNSELAEIAYQTSHDLRGPAATLQGLTNLLAVENDPALIKSFISEVPELLSKIDVFSKSISAFTRLINQPVKHQQVNWIDISQKIASDSLYGEKVQFNLKEDHSFFSDPHRIEILLNHLVKNAYEFNFEQEELVISVNIEVSEKLAEMQVKDNGRGIDEESSEKIFDMFYRGSANSTGSGVGLYLVKTILDELDGEISLKANQDGKGACFNIRLPQTEAPVKLPEFDF